MRMHLACIIGAGVLATGVMSPVSADDLHSVVRTLNAVLNPGDAQRLEDQARHNGRIDEEHYWHNYRAGLEEQQKHRGGASSQYGRHDDNRYSGQITPAEAARHEEQARRNGRRDEARYWADYRTGLEHQHR